MSGRRKTERGLFGIVKKKSVLFTFNPRQGDECSSDSDDSDYFPGRQSTDEDDVETFVEKQKLKVAKKRVKKASASAPQQRSKRSRRDINIKSDAENEDRPITSGPTSRLPPEILLKIFIYGAMSEGVTRFLPKVSLVCKEWHATASDPSILKHLDLSLVSESRDRCANVINLSKQRLTKLLSTRDLSQCQALTLAGQDKLSVNHIKSLLAQTPSLKSLDLRGCQVNSDMLKNLPEMCLHLERIDLSNLSPSSATSLPYGSVEGLVKALGPKLVELRVGGITSILTKAESMLKAIINCCPFLEELDLSRLPCKITNFHEQKVDLLELARRCPRLTELRLDGHHFVHVGERPSSLQNLKIFSHSIQMFQPAERAIFYNIFSKNKLHELNISETRLKPSKIINCVSNVLSVKTLKLSNMAWDTEDVRELSDCMDSWHGSIETLDLSGNKRDCFNDEFFFFSQRELCATACLQFINLSNSVINSQNVINIVKHCKSLRAIDLTGCRELPRGYKRVFSHQEFSDLIKSLSP
ncbi:F-box/LRR-repeat protein [Elysia marginata]|uniref:F-box/LRR-repeat protein n=1 Tax=Elysia marginata TaxID=1093978 RepID=A0AAV4IWS0_9GAST|nr:F-box/LRR-repeat protein [Elysia marginata]